MRGGRKPGREFRVFFQRNLAKWQGISEGQVQDYILYLRDELGIAKGTFEPMFFGQVLLSQYVGLPVAVVHEKKSEPRQHRRLPDIRSDDDCRRLIVTLKKPVYWGCCTLIYAYELRIGEGAHATGHGGGLEAVDAETDRQRQQGACSPAKIV